MKPNRDDRRIIDDNPDNFPLEAGWENSGNNLSKILARLFRPAESVVWVPPVCVVAALHVIRTTDSQRVVLGWSSGSNVKAVDPALRYCHYTIAKRLMSNRLPQAELEGTPFNKGKTSKNFSKERTPQT